MSAAPAPSRSEGEELYLAAEKHLGAGELKEALLLGSRALAVFRKDGDRRRTVDALRVVITGLRLQAAEPPMIKPVEPLQIVEEELAAFRESGDRRGEAAMLLCLAEIHHDRNGGGKREEALELAEEAAAILDELPEEKQMRAETLLHLSKIYVKRCEKGVGGKSAREGYKYVCEALKLYRLLGDRVGEAAVLHNQAIMRWYGGAPFKEGLNAAKLALQIYRDLGRRDLEATGMRLVADWYGRKGRGAEGLPWAEEALRIFQELQHGRGGEAAGSLRVLIAAHVDKGDAGRAVEVAKDGLARIRESGNRQQEALALDLLANSHLANGDNQSAQKAAEESARMCRALGDKRSELRVLQTTALASFRAKQMAAALRAVRESLSLAQHLGDTKEQGNALHMIFTMFLLASEADEALHAAHEAQAFFQHEEDRHGEGIALLGAASANLMKGVYAEAVEDAEDAKYLFRMEDDKKSEAAALLVLHEAHTVHERHEAALRAAAGARAIAQKLGERRDEAGMLLRICQSNVALLLRAMEGGGGGQRVASLWAAALKGATDALALARRVGEGGLLSLALCSAAQVQGLAGKYQDALESAKEALKIWQDAGSPRGEAAVLVLLGEVHMMNGGGAEAIKVLNSALKLARQGGDKANEQRAAHVLKIIQPAEAPKQAPSSVSGQGISRGGLASTPASTAYAVAGAAAQPAKAGPSLSMVIPQINQMAMSLLSTDSLDPDNPLMDAGLDSLSMVQFRNNLQQEFPGVPMPTSMMFDNPSIRALSEQIVNSLKNA